MPRPVRRLFAAVAHRDAAYVAGVLRTETVGGALLLLAAVIALIWANSPWHEAYTALLGTTIGPAALHLDLDIAHWAADGLLAIFFFVAGAELKRELVEGDLRDPAQAVLPVAAAVAGVVVPAGLFLLVTAGDPTLRAGWAIPVATDIAFALAVLAVLGTHLPTALRTFLLTLAVVDDLIAILIIAVVYTSSVSLPALLAALIPLAAFGWLARRRILHWWLLVPLALITWGLVHASGVHATVAGVLLAFALPVRARPGEEHGVCEQLEHRVRPVSAAVAVPLFALTAAGVRIVGGGLAEVLEGPLFPGIVLGLVVGKAVGVLAGTWLVARFTRASLDESLTWADIVGVSFLAGVGFTVSLLIGELAFAGNAEQTATVQAAVLTGSLLAAGVAAIVLVRRNAHYRELEAQAGTS
ncbi:MAG: Na+/H+ antiporter NhaA [Kineosporiaceae bacterium]|nr:Na+/H+ antiporter NhaA [Kineosporiaceae bacterium]